ncbi:flagellar hook-associated protein 1 FlgK [Novimethylophilus kurashikiensis]|uniref:Flagellar hook-associated protein 1 n=1 Tax=Novimethylophilus kurashikiensis TaxID=1825523 RepID=A0A2R5FDF5_9PROT|nr:flagellar hook-associated protein FlgK [Novimethylophilus kurashikiensis]GBG15819.1 flagellar hook-associated protein 1 FlgK [Novimethylophilus kurashikiensis]
MSLFSVGVTGLNAAQIGLATAGHNITNADTEGYHRQTIVQGTNLATPSGSGFIGQGTNVETVKRVYSQFLDTQLQRVQTQSSYMDTYYGQISQIDNMLADPNSGLSPALQDFFSAVGDVSSNPQSVASRQSMLSGASALISRFQAISARLTDLQGGVNTQITDSVSLINSYAQQIAKLNDQITIQGSSTNQPPNDLLDQRDNLISQLNAQVGATVIKQSDGSLNVFIGNGQPLIVGNTVYQLTTVRSPEDQQRVEVAYQYGSKTTLLGTGSLSGGNLSGLLDFRDKSLIPAQNELGRVAMGVAETFNAQHQLGQDLSGNLGQDFFAVPGPSVLPSTNNTGTGSITAALSNVSALGVDDFRILYDGANYSVTNLTTHVTTTGVSAGSLSTFIPGITLTEVAPPNAGDVFTVQPTRYAARDIALSNTIGIDTIAAAAPIVTGAGTSNKGTGVVSGGSVDAVPTTPDPSHPTTDLNLKNPVTITFNNPPTTFDVVDANLGTLASGVSFTAGGNISYNGWTVSITGTPSSGDKFTIGPNVNGVSDNRNMLALAQLQTKNTLIGGSASYQGAYSQIVSQVGNKSAELQVTSKAQAALLDQTKNAQQGLSGVNLDEEAANLLRYQQAYQASGKMLQIASTLFDSILAIGR